MLIITADDLGRDAQATDSCVTCFARRLITSASIMVLMEDSERAADAAKSAGLETGLHLNLTVPYTDSRLALNLLEKQLPVVSYLRRGKWAQVIYNPLIRNNTDYVFNSQLDEYRRLFRGEPAHINGHEHMHLCMNMILERAIPPGMKVRRNGTFSRGEKNIFNRLYRRRVDAWLLRQHVSTDSFFSIDPIQDLPRLKRIIGLARISHVELMVHPWRTDQFEFMRGLVYGTLISGVPLGTFSSLPRA